MKLAARPAIIAFTGVAIGGLVWLAWAPRRDDPRTLSGYVEGEALYLASPVSAPVRSVSVVRGQRVSLGDPVFSIDPRTLLAQQDQARAEVAQAEAQERAAKASLGQVEATAASARAIADNAAAEARRLSGLAGSGSVSQQDVERGAANAVATAAQGRAASAQGEAARAQLTAAARAADRARAGRAELSTRLDYLSPKAPVAARVEEVYFQPGEWVDANQPVASLLPDDRIRLRFYVPQGEIGAYVPGARVAFACDGCKGRLSAVILRVSPRPEYTPPVIYSRKVRDSLVFLVEARPDTPRDLTVGQPVDVTPLAPERPRP